ncbi:MAG: hypothetical protein AVDCRST_MAG10-84 [uncultured Acidimicrobiales bacterium]|uniref:FecR protein domain-containing protein n=1 Tax=uncultured Acidimicrobiales bacterium TaxID=310071 RepID=A0A6J4H194_9ACTN|nr:MAG: hypothetical protein AVDCRST_MAG10-84 [uncultured Acidimicrobiales bacterium]
MSRSGWGTAVVAISSVALSLAACTGSSSTPAAGRLVVEGQAEITRPGEDRREVGGSRDLEVGDRVRVRQGTAVIRLPGNRRLDMRAGSDVELQAGADQNQVRPFLLGGDLLVISGDGPLTVGISGAEVAVRGDARVSRGVSLLVASYRGTTQLSSAGSTLTVPTLRQAALPATEQFPTQVSPLEYMASDDWDQRYLSDAIELSNQLAARSDGFTAQLGPTDGRSFNYFRDLVPGLAAEPAFVASMVNPSRPPGETLVGAAIVLEGRQGTFAERWGSVFAFRDQGAPWGLVALDQGVSRVAVLGVIDGAISRGPTSFAAGPPTRTPSSLAPPSVGGGPATTAAPRTTATTVRPRAGATTTTTTPPPRATTTTTVAGPLNTGAPLVDEPVNSVVNTLTGLLNSLGGR